ncbi:gamma-interferon-inducible lysosomal thiol reductase isoform X2 [Eurytemora carolleeae]|uniref:gamma-interferon-inducible lysosomal thiol reductase isoform X2 n=1 Tax=Eurytemora carolleeae TaxID=1294199 RepID=UPI000C78B399|nr:gamma-interferon-inducible lysosomal thiol reductase isoform X2 [Eurytemora carolleeae]|eukprot:XP_023323444.1 gamma-interferon-inducible lysosomal thiol reductase-like isoform X2 [Eurytemora affinis]
MKQFILFSSFLLVGTSTCSAQDAPVEISVYYESLCPDSVEFIVVELDPVFKLFGDAINVQFKPYGIAETTGEEGSWEFTCQHGPNECYGNMMHACLINLVPEQGDIVPLIDCIMSKSPASIATAELCMGRITNPVDIALVEECIIVDGPSLLYILYSRGVYTSGWS